MSKKKQTLAGDMTHELLGTTVHFGIEEKGRFYHVEGRLKAIEHRADETVLVLNAFLAFLPPSYQDSGTGVSGRPASIRRVRFHFPPTKRIEWAV